MDLIYLLLSDWWPVAVGVIAALIFSIITSVNVDATFAKFNGMYVGSKTPACDAARQILDMNGLYDVQIIKVPGRLTDHYDPKKKIIALSEAVYGSATVGAIGVAAHECGHAIQYAKDYTPVKLRNIFFPVVNICSRSWALIFLLGCMFSWGILIEVGIIFFAVIVLYQLLTLPVEFDASRRAIDVLISTGILYGQEVAGARKVLKAAAMTYISALINAIMQLLRLIANTNRRR